MAFVDTIAPADSTGPTRKMYERQQLSYGYVPNYAKVFGHRPEVMVRWGRLLAEIRRPMDDRLFELATFAAALELKNTACSLAHGEQLAKFISEEGVQTLAEGEIDDVNRARHLPSPQLVGSRQHQILDLNTMSSLGIKLVGRLMGVQNGVVQFSGSLRNVCALADLKMNRLLKTIDEWAEQSPDASMFEAPERFDRTEVDEEPCLALNLQDSGVRTIVWATGYRPDYSWLDVPVLDRKGMIKHDGGVVDSPGMYLVGIPFLRQRKSSFIHGAEDDVRYVTQHLAAFLNT